MKKNIIYLALSAAVIGALISACGKKETAAAEGAAEAVVEVEEPEIEKDPKVFTEPAYTPEEAEKAANAHKAEDALSFENNICGIYLSDADDDTEVRKFEISSIDGRFYIEYIGEYEFAAAEIELLDAEPFVKDDELRYMVMMYPFSGFSFAGDYWGGDGTVCCITALGNGRIELSEGQPFFSHGAQTMEKADDVLLHPVLGMKEENTTAPELIGAWRTAYKRGAEDVETYTEFLEDGTVKIVEKTEGMPPVAAIGVYTAEKTEEGIQGVISSERLGYGTQPMEDLKLVVDPNVGFPIIYSEYSDYDESDFWRTEAGEHELLIEPGPCDRADELNEAWIEYISVTEEDGFAYDFNPDMIDAIAEQAAALIDAENFAFYGIQDNGNGGQAWIRVYKDDAENAVTENWICYDFATGEYWDIYGTLLAED